MTINNTNKQYEKTVKITVMYYMLKQTNNYIIDR